MGVFACLLLLAGCASGSFGKRDNAPEIPMKAAMAAEPVKSAPTAMDTFRAMAPPEGIKLTQLFTDPVKDPEARTERLEKSVQDLRNDFDTVVPSMVRLVAVEKDMKDLVAQLKTIESKPEPAPMQVAPDVETPAALPADAPSVQNFRLGDHKGSTRIVLDLSARTAFTAAMEKNGRQLEVTLPAVNWATGTSWVAQGGALVSGYTFANGVLNVDLIASARIISQSLMPGEGGKGFRIVIDLASKGSHR